MARAVRAALLVAALGFGCGGSDGSTQPQAPPVAVSSVQLRDLTDRIEATGELIARDRAKIAAEVPGRVTEVVVDEGAAAEAGEVLIKIDPERRELELASASAHLAEARANLTETQREWGRVEKLYKQNVASKAQRGQAGTNLQLARSRLDAAESQLGVAERTLSDANVTAPFAGRVARRFVSPGEFVQTGQALVELVALDPIEVEFHVAEVDSGLVELGQEVKVRVAPYPERSFTAVVTLVSPTIDPMTRTLRVKASVENPGGLLRPGLFARADLGVRERQGVRLIPEEAVLQRSDGPVVFLLVEDERVERRVIETGLYVDGKVEILSGLSPSDIVVTRGQTALLDGARVSVRNVDGTPSVAKAPQEERMSE
jgi:membrane fusion protein (multidrug efflux system)